MNRWHGPVAKLDENTTDGRRVRVDALTNLDETNLPLMPMNGVADFAQRPVGVIDRLELRGDVVHGEGRIDLPPGEYGIGVDLADVQVDFQDDDSEVLVFSSARIVGAHIYAGPEPRPAWPDCVVTVEVT